MSFKEQERKLRASLYEQRRFRAKVQFVPCEWVCLPGALVRLNPGFFNAVLCDPAHGDAGKPETL